MSSSRIALCSLAVILFVASPLALAQGTYTQIDYPGSDGSVTLGINSAGDIVGYYTVEGDTVTHGFMISAGTYTTIDYPGASATVLTGLNDVGQIVGYATTAPAYVGFSYDIQTQMFEEISFPGTSPNPTYPDAINNGGIVAGWVQLSSETFGFTLTGTQYRRVEAPIPKHSTVTGIDSAGEVLGDVFSLLDAQENFTSYKGVYHRFAITGVPSGAASSLNASGTAFAGSYSGTGPGFVYENEVLTTLHFPRAMETFAEGVNDAGEVVGLFYDGGFFHGFTWTPATPTHKDSKQ
jgi:uncharacterized membrane protein